MATRQSWGAGFNEMKLASAASLVTVINFATTRAGLIGQLLAASLRHERPDLESRRIKLLQEQETLQLELSGLEDKLLEVRKGV
ncbi:unnamed protein product [Protopolystoma xenopodis]|uniref:Dynein heavy chain ATP-binding dynein motor region domain-containing protein n=1 Tax=Protopolystoma xenopodis TaxID=117903 RepID=A0A3S5FD75_9PLAT|nr:unnamed protein product [Protopolystoma xenopodis]